MLLSSLNLPAVFSCALLIRPISTLDLSSSQFGDFFLRLGCVPFQAQKQSTYMRQPWVERVP